MIHFVCSVGHAEEQLKEKEGGEGNHAQEEKGQGEDRLRT